MSHRGRIFEVQHLALYDGPGLRTVVYLKGCPLRCIWCHNPEGQRAETELFFHAEKCTLCGACAAVCPNGAHEVSAEGHRLDRSRCTKCGRCARRCLNDALLRTGMEVGVEDVMKEVLGDSAFFRGTGGLTLSGGEPLAQGEFACEVLRAARESGINTCMETCGYAPEPVVRQAAEVTDLFLYDIKELDSAKHREMTGVGNELILSNLRVLDSLHKRVILRCPIVPGQNLRAEHFAGVAELAQQISCVEAVELEPYHPLGISKYESLGREPALNDKEFLNADRLREHANAMRRKTEKPVRLSTGEEISGGKASPRRAKTSL